MHDKDSYFLKKEIFTTQSLQILKKTSCYIINISQNVVMELGKLHTKYQGQQQHFPSVSVVIVIIIIKV